MNHNFRAPGGTVSIGEAVRKLNPHLFRKLDPEAQQLLNEQPLSPPAKKRIRQSTKPRSNKLETEFGEVLRGWFPDARIHEQAITLCLANGVKYTVDWVACHNITTYCYEVKGRHAWDDAIVKLKVAAHTFPNWHWHLVWKDVGKWQIQTVEP